MASALTRTTLAPAARPTFAARPATTKRSSSLCAAIRPPRGDSTQGGDSPLASLQQRFASYDFLSAGMGALAVTSYCVWRGQDPLTALSITAASTITALVANELLVEAERKQQE